MDWGEKGGKGTEAQRCKGTKWEVQRYKGPKEQPGFNFNMQKIFLKVLFMLLD
jgi:hypothetical protein